MSRLFITNREVDFINDITKELVKDAIGQEVIYYPISEEFSDTNDLYSESAKKVFEQPISIRALVEYRGDDATSTQFGIDNIYEMTVFFHKKDLTDRNLIVREGDFLQYGQRFYQIMKLIQPKDIYGLNENIPGIHAECKTAREGEFRAPETVVLNTFSQYRGAAGSQGHHDRRALQANAKITSITTGSTNVSPFTTDVS